MTRPADEGAAHEPAAVGVDLGSANTRVWASGRGTLHAANPAPAAAYRSGPVVRGSIAEPEPMQVLLSGLVGGRRRPLPAGAVVVACRPVGTGSRAELALREVMTTVFKPARLLFIDTVRAAAIGSGAAPGPLLIADVGAHLTEVAVLAGGVIVAAHRRDVGLHDQAGGPDPNAAIVAAVTDLIGQVRRQPGHRQAVAAAVHGGLLLVGGGATRPQLAARVAGAAGIAVRRPVAPHLAAVRGAGLAALAALRRSAVGL
ncbi:rod shape-determining protein [Dactylosporangium sp. AC04546]|uniref:rod shape-determining protein n=1 Tax=Dactylosporangium sp. AC04546 TaxID=2862460 RepID=UPI001EDF5F22|nr:rod shape-determining protein [Dactylosporangium sp. AC04546]WVK87294.1 rod shape-determining protein [Dactylosporangium sp. AC04546]